MNNSTIKIDNNEPVALQKKIELLLKESVCTGELEAMFLYDQQGLPIAGFSSNTNLGEMMAVEISVLIMTIKDKLSQLGNNSGLKEILIENEESKRFVFRFIPFYHESAVLVVVVPPRKRYRAIVNRFTKAFLKLDF